ncbi:MAG: thiamine pyrophosphate-requiring protein [Naasia sp.]|jgi:pyruvate dehydrogenase (quinone)|uniref:thiamine pyrophosphate-requiring protein n=1 Tax=Naasia sp. TaxID=2546198 RepID=UPI00262B5402|nr:thiamine pyrophosphate-requiring protein [Naasia sp.]MCU1569496.1 thiamine pyrophosphate-requiring protein [Naasia sp.]
MTDRTVSDQMVERLREWGVRRIFGYSGDGINGFLKALQDADGAIEFVQARHEENAAFMAVGHAKYTGTVGVVTSTQGPGAIHLLNGLYDAKLDGVPVVAIVGQQSRSALGAGYMQEVNLLQLFSDVAAQYAQLVSTPEQLPSVLDRAIRTALATRSPTVVIVPHDIQKAAAVELEASHGIVATAAEYTAPVVVPQAADLRAAAAVLTSGSKVAFLVGQGARSASAEVLALAEKLGAGVATSLLGKPWLDETLPFVVGTMGHLGTTASAFLLGECDTLLLVGTNDPWTEFYPPLGQARAVQIDLDGRSLGNRFPIEVGLVGDAARTLSALLDLVEEQQDRGWRKQVEAQVRRWEEIAQRRAKVPGEPLNPELVLRELTGRLPDSAQVAVDVGSVVYWYARQLRLPLGVPAHLSGTLASMGCGVPYGIAAKLAAADRPVVVLAGDGAMQMTGVAELITVARLWPGWADPRFVVCVLNNGDLAEVSWEQREMEGAPRFPPSQALPDFPFARYADLLGMTGIRVQRSEDIGPAWDAALTADRPVVLEFLTDPSIPLLPPFPAGKEKLEQMRSSLAQEGADGERARRLLDEYARHEES